MKGQTKPRSIICSQAGLPRNLSRRYLVQRLLLADLSHCTRTHKLCTVVLNDILWHSNQPYNRIKESSGLEAIQLLRWGCYLRRPCRHSKFCKYPKFVCPVTAWCYVFTCGASASVHGVSQHFNATRFNKKFEQCCHVQAK